MCEFQRDRSSREIWGGGILSLAKTNATGKENDVRDVGGCWPGGGLEGQPSLDPSDWDRPRGLPPKEEWRWGGSGQCSPPSPKYPAGKLPDVSPAWPEIGQALPDFEAVGETSLLQKQRHEHKGHKVVGHFVVPASVAPPSATHATGLCSRLMADSLEDAPPGDAEGDFWADIAMGVLAPQAPSSSSSSSIGGGGGCAQQQNQHHQHQHQQALGICGDGHAKLRGGPFGEYNQGRGGAFDDDGTNLIEREAMATSPMRVSNSNATPEYHLPSPTQEAFRTLGRVGPGVDGAPWGAGGGAYAQQQQHSSSSTGGPLMGFRGPGLLGSGQDHFSRTPFTDMSSGGTTFVGQHQQQQQQQQQQHPGNGWERDGFNSSGENVGVGNSLFAAQQQQQLVRERYFGEAGGTMRGGGGGGEGWFTQAGHPAPHNQTHDQQQQQQKMRMNGGDMPRFGDVRFVEGGHDYGSLIPPTYIQQQQQQQQHAFLMSQQQQREQWIGSSGVPGGGGGGIHQQQQQQQQQYSFMMMQRAQMANMQGNNMLGAGDRAGVVGMSKGGIRGDEQQQQRMDSFNFSGMRAAALSTLDTSMPRPVPASQLSQSYATTRSSSSSSSSSGCIASFPPPSKTNTIQGLTTSRAARGVDMRMPTSTGQGSASASPHPSTPSPQSPQSSPPQVSPMPPKPKLQEDVPDEVKEEILERSPDQILADNLACQCICSILLSLERSSPSPSPFIEQGRVGNALSKEVALRSYIKQNHGSLINFVLGQEGRLWFDVTAGVNGCYLIANKALVGGTSAPSTST